MYSRNSVVPPSTDSITLYLRKTEHASVSFVSILGTGIVLPLLRRHETEVLHSPCAETSRMENIEWCQNAVLGS